MHLLWSLCTFCLLAGQVTVIVGDSGLCCCVPYFTCNVCQVLFTPFVCWCLNNFFVWWWLLLLLLLLFGFAVVVVVVVLVCFLFCFRDARAEWKLRRWLHGFVLSHTCIHCLQSLCAVVHCLCLVILRASRTQGYLFVANDMKLFTGLCLVTFQLFKTNSAQQLPVQL